MKIYWKNMAKCGGVILILGLIWALISGALGLPLAVNFLGGLIVGMIGMFWAMSKFNPFKIDGLL